MSSSRTVLLLENDFTFNPLMHNVPTWSDILYKPCDICSKIFKVCLTILGRYSLKVKNQRISRTNLHKGKIVWNVRILRYCIFEKWKEEILLWKRDRAVEKNCCYSCLSCNITKIRAILKTSGKIVLEFIFLLEIFERQLHLIFKYKYSP